MQENQVPEGPVYNVSELIGDLRLVCAQAFGRVWVEGEVAGVYRSRLGHVYFDLKDEAALLKAVLFRGAAQKSPVSLEEGSLVRVRARPDVYPERGQLQLIVDSVQPAGEGALQAALERLKRRLESEGLFEPEHKRPLPRHPACVGLVTSVGGAAIHDFVRALRRRRADLEVRVYDARVQGDDAWRQLVRGLHVLGADPRVEVIVLARGGGSLQDLWSFNREELVRAIFELDTPVVSAIGHETDLVLSDWVADARAATPTAAAELVSPDRSALITELRSMAARLERGQRERLRGLADRVRGLERGLVHPGQRLRVVRLRTRASAQALSKLAERLPRELGQRLERASRGLDERVLPALLKPRRDRLRQLALMLQQGMLRSVTPRRTQLDAVGGRLDALSPLSVLGRGYGIARRGRDGAILRSSHDVELEESIDVTLADGWLRATVTDRSEAE